MKALFVAAALLALPAAAAAQDAAPDTAQLRACTVAAGLDDPKAVEACERPILRQCGGDYAACYDRLFASWDGLLNESYRGLTAALPGRDARNLRAAQRAWIKFRDEDCDFYAGVWPGSKPPYQQAACRHRETRMRAAVLSVRLDAVARRNAAGVALRPRAT